MTAGMICSAGGKVQSQRQLFSGSDHRLPALGGSLSFRPAPTIGGCDYSNKIVDGISATLQPGVYCGGLIPTNGAAVRLSSGIFIIKDGPLTVDGASISGTEVGIYLKGPAANLTFDADRLSACPPPRMARSLAS